MVDCKAVDNVCEADRACKALRKATGPAPQAPDKVCSVAATAKEVASEVLVRE